LFSLHWDSLTLKNIRVADTCIKHSSSVEQVDGESCKVNEGQQPMDCSPHENHVDKDSQAEGQSEQVSKTPVKHPKLLFLNVKKTLSFKNMVRAKSIEKFAKKLE